MLNQAETSESKVFPKKASNPNNGGDEDDEEDDDLMVVIMYHAVNEPKISQILTKVELSSLSNSI